MACTHGSVGIRLIYSSKIIGEFQYRKVGGFLRIQLLDLILYWRHNSKVRITIIYLCTAKHTHSLILHNWKNIGTKNIKKANFHFQDGSIAGHRSDCAFGFTSCRINFFDCHLSFFTCKSCSERSTFVNCAKTVLPTLPMAQCCYRNASIFSFSNCQRQNKDHCTLANCGWVEFPQAQIGEFTLI